jgi:hypothetical protein
MFFLSLMSLFMLKRYIKGENVAAIQQIMRWRVFTVILGQYSIALAVASAFGTSQSVGALVFASSTGLSNNTPIVRSYTLEVIQWFIVGLSVIFQWGIYRMFAIVGGSVSAVGSSLDRELGFQPKSRSRAGGSGVPPPPPPPPPP